MLSLVLHVLVLVQPGGEPPAAVKQAEAALDAVVARHGAASREAALGLRLLARAWHGHGDAAATLRARQRELALRETFHDRPLDAFELVVCRIEVAASLRGCERLDEAIAMHAETRSMLDSLSESPLSPTQRAMVRVGCMAGWAQALTEKGDALASLPLLEEALSAAIDGLGDGHANTQIVRQSLATAFVRTGRMDRARELSAMALTRAEAAGGPEHPLTAHAAYLHGSVLLAAGRDADAGPLLERALRVRAATLGEDHPETIATSHALAQCRVRARDFAAARAEYSTLLERTRRARGADDQMSVGIERELAEVCIVLGDAETALPLARHCLANRLERHGERHPDVARARLTLGRALLATEDTGAAVEHLERALDSDAAKDPEAAIELRAVLAAALAIAGRKPEAVALARANVRAFPALLATSLPALLDADRIAFARRHRESLDVVLSWSTSLDEVAAAFADAIAWKAQVARGLFAQRAWLRRNLDGPICARLDELQGVLASLAEAHRTGDAATRARLSRRKKEIEQDLPAGDALAPAVSPAAIRACLAPDDVLLDFHVFARTETGAPAAMHVVVFVVVAEKDAPTRVDLGLLAPIASAVQAHLLVAARRTRAPAASSRAHVEALGTRVRTLVFEPLAAHVRTRRRVFVCPDGPLALLPFATLPGDEAGRFLVERHEFRSLVSPHDLLAQRMPPTPDQGRAVVLGDVDYGPAAAGGAARFAPLPATASEIEAVARLLESDGNTVHVLRGRGAGADELRAAVSGASIVHLATHGTFEDARAGGALPGQRGGIALAGANERGPFTTDEVAWLDLNVTELITLSACHSGDGEPARGEHLLGLRRALRLAGARQTLTSLWRVDDDATAELMTEFYRHWRGDDGDAAAALRDAQLAILGASRARTGDGLPGTWGAFVVEGW